jgi:hypothetical protein
MIVNRFPHAAIHQLTDQITLEEVVRKPKLDSARFIKSLQVLVLEGDLKTAKILF